jgi:hypothetical protein
MSRHAFSPTAEQRSAVEAMTGFGIPQAEICRLIKNPQTGKAIDEKTLRKHFESEIGVGLVKVKSAVGGFIVNTILGNTKKIVEQDGDRMIEREVPLGLTSESARASLAQFFARTRMGWVETSILEHQGKDGGPIVWREYPEDKSL